MAADIVAYDRADHDILVTEVKASRLTEEAVLQAMDIARVATSMIPFAMAVGLDEIRVVRLDNSGGSSTSLKLDSKEIFARYEPQYGDKRIFTFDLKALVGAWLRDLAYHWNSDDPPGSKALAEMGPLERLKGGGTRIEVLVTDDSVR